MEIRSDFFGKSLLTLMEYTPDEIAYFIDWAIELKRLKRAGIHTIQDLVNKKEIEVTKIRNLGKKSLKEVLDKVADLGLEFKE